MEPREVVCTHCGKKMFSRAITGWTRCCGCKQQFLFDKELDHNYVSTWAENHRDKMREACRRYEEKHKKERILSHKNNLAKHKLQVKKTLYANLGDKCAICGETTVCCLTIHHKNGVKNPMWRRETNSISRYRLYLSEPIESLALLCQNCHHKLHAGLIKID